MTQKNLKPQVPGAPAGNTETEHAPRSGEVLPPEGGGVGAGADAGAATSAGDLTEERRDELVQQLAQQNAALEEQLRGKDAETEELRAKLRAARSIGAAEEALPPQSDFKPTELPRPVLTRDGWLTNPTTGQQRKF